jgi:hypothetical protein
VYFFLFSIIFAFEANCQLPDGESFSQFIYSWMTSAPKAQSGIYETPDERAFGDFSTVYSLFIRGSYDSCRNILDEYNYELIVYNDSKGSSFDIIKEKFPIVKGWGTFVYNRQHKKRLHIHINHPLDDPNALSIGTNLFRYLGAEWLLIAGTSKNAVPDKFIADIGRVSVSLFQKWHELISDLTHVAISLHSYDHNWYPFPINLTDIIVSNGRTTDYQWGISQLSLGFRDTLKEAGYNCGLAMYDSGYARLSGGWNHQGIFSNDSIGFGHWLYIELSKNIREKPADYPKLFAAFDKALDLTGKKVSQYVNRGFGLVSPRVIKVDSARRLFFPPINNNIYKIVSFDEKKNSSDTIDVRIGNWVDLFNKQRLLASVQMYDTTKADRPPDQNVNRKGRKNNSVFTQIIEQPNAVTSTMKYKDKAVPDSGQTNDDDDGLDEPIQVHRIPLKPIIHQTYSNQYTSSMTPFKWEGVVTGNLQPAIPIFEFEGNRPTGQVTKNLPKFLIPLLSSAYKGEKKKYVGIHMTDILVDEIARLVHEYEVYDRDIGLLAEESTNGDYYLRIFPTPTKSAKQLAAEE